MGFSLDVVYCLHWTRTTDFWGYGGWELVSPGAKETGEGDKRKGLITKISRYASPARPRKESRAKEENGVYEVVTTRKQAEGRKRVLPSMPCIFNSPPAPTKQPTNSLTQVQPFAYWPNRACRRSRLPASPVQRQSKFHFPSAAITRSPELGDTQEHQYSTH